MPSFPISAWSCRLRRSASTARRGPPGGLGASRTASARGPLSITRKFEPSGPDVRRNTMWSALELRHVDLGDRRRNRRLVKLVDDLLKSPEAGVPQASGDGAATRAAYRSWDNPRVDPDDIRAAHRDRTLGRLSGPHAEP